MLVVALVWALGAGSLACFGVFLWIGGFGIFDLRLGHYSLLAFDAALCLMFFSQHSILIRRPVRDSLKKIVPDYWYGICYTISSSLALLVLILLWQESHVTIYAVRGGRSWIVRGVLIGAFLGVYWGVRSLKRFDAFGIDVFLAHIRRKRIQLTPLTVRGPYRLVRHPLYVCAIVAVWATPLLTSDRLLFNALFTAWIFVGSALEERDMLAEFGEQYQHYRRTVPMFIPRLPSSQGATPDRAKAVSRGHNS